MYNWWKHDDHASEMSLDHVSNILGNRTLDFSGTGYWRLREPDIGFSGTDIGEVIGIIFKKQVLNEVQTNYYI